MSFTYVDSSVIVAILFEEVSAKKYRAYLNRNKSNYSASLLEAEVYSAACREKVSFDKAQEILRHISLVFPNASLEKEYQKIFSTGYCRGADAYHLACALYLDSSRKELKILTADQPQANVAKTLGFEII
jgi:predicted nucleic acid-binding protein